MKRELKASVTVFLSLLIVVTLAFIGAVIEGGTIQLAKNYARGDANRAMESVFAEYQQELLQEFGIFAIESTYESGVYHERNIINRLMLYGAENMKWSTVQMQLLTDDKGAAFEAQIITYMKQKYGLNKMKELSADSSEWTSQKSEGTEVKDSIEENNDDLFEQVEGMEGTLEMQDTALENVFDIQGSGVLELVMRDKDMISDLSIVLDELPSKRTLNEGIGDYEIEDTNETLEKMMVCEYVLEHYKCASNSSNPTAGLQYELEYILEGENSDRENLSGVVNQLLIIRMAPNYMCLLGSGTKRGEVSTLALSIATASAMPELQPVIEQALLLGWAYGESIMDIRSLLEGNRVTLLKNELDWQLDLDGLMTLGGSSDTLKGRDMESGLDYESYLRILLYLKSKEDILVRSLDMLEVRLNKNLGLHYFRVDQCVTQLKCMNISRVTGGFTYEFPVFFSYR